VARLIYEWRHLSSDDRDSLKTVARTLPAKSHKARGEGTTWATAKRDLTYLQALLRGVTSLAQSENGLAVRKEARREVKELVLAAAGSAEFVDYQSEQDWLATYGKPPEVGQWSRPWTTAADARLYYEEIGRVDAAVDAFQRERRRPTEDVERYRRMQVRERVIEDLLEHNLHELEGGLKLIRRQYPTAVGPIDLLARDPKGIFVVIELKRGRTSDRVIGQIARYITWVIRRLASGRNSGVRGIIVGKDFDRKFEAAAARLRVTSYTYEVFANFLKWPRRPSAGKVKGQGAQPKTH
jgi:hypothetical protein